MTKKKLVILAVCASVLITPAIVRAQEDTASPVIVVDDITEPQSLSAEIRRLKTQYRGELEEYRRLENQQAIAKQQYEKLKTLSSLEDGVRATQAAMEARDRVLKTYLQILKVTLLQQTGIDIEQKELVKVELDQALLKVEQHHQLFGTELDRVALQKATDQFVAVGEAAEQASYKALSVLAIGELQSVYDKANTLSEDMYSTLATQGGALKQGQRQRGFDETKRTLGEASTQLQAARLEIAKEELNVGKSSYDNLRDDLTTIYSQLSRSLSFLRELVGI